VHEVFKHIKTQITPMSSLKKQLSWTSDQIMLNKKNKNSKLKIALLSSEKLYYSLSYEGSILLLTEENWQWVINYGSPDILIIESCVESATGDWHMSQMAKDLEQSQIQRLIQLARSKNIPVAYWFTLDVQYIYPYRNMMMLVDKVYCSDDRAIDKLAKIGVSAKLLLPAVQPALFTRINSYRHESRIEHDIILDDLAGVIQAWNDKKIIFEKLIEMGGRIFDSRCQVWNSKTKALNLHNDSLIGSVSFFGKIELFKRSRVLAVVKSNCQTRMDIQWQILEAAASHLPVVIEPDFDVGLLNDLVISSESEEVFFNNLENLILDDYSHSNLTQKSWRKTLQAYTYSNRLRTICSDFNVHHDWIEYPSAAMITPSFRPKFLDRAKHNYMCQNYTNKSWVFVFNGEEKDFSEISEVLAPIPDVSMLYMPPDQHAGPCMNIGILNTLADYIFRVDDDDYYGSNYLIDMILYTRVVDFDVVGKSFRYFSLLESHPTVIFRRFSKNLDFTKPSICENGQLPEKGAYIAGCSHGGKRSFFLKYHYSNSNFGSVDSHWIDYLRENKVGSILCVDDENLIVDRRLSSDHTWNVSMEEFITNSTQLEISKATSEILGYALPHGIPAQEKNIASLT